MFNMLKTSQGILYLQFWRACCTEVSCVEEFGLKNKDEDRRKSLHLLKAEYMMMLHEFK